jgi:hypothetical protein
MIIENFLCGKNAVEPEYRFSGPDCAKRSLSVRLRDSVIQVSILQLCGHAEMSIQVKDATIIVMKYMQLLSICTPRTINVQNIWSEEELIVKHKLRGVSCSKSMRSKIKNRLPFFKNMITIYNDPKSMSAVLEKLGLFITENGDVHEK